MPKKAFLILMILVSATGIVEAREEQHVTPMMEDTAPLLEAHQAQQPDRNQEDTTKQHQTVILRPRRLSKTRSSERNEPWLQENFPNPGRNGASQCRATRSFRVCDPDSILSSGSLARVEEYLQEKKFVYRDLCRETSGESYHEESDKEKHQAWELQMGVALVNKMDLSPFGGGDVEERAAETFARYVHDDWGVGVETDSCGGAGILLFLSIQDRTVYISRGAALEAVLVDRRLDQVIQNMKELLRSKQYDQAILQALEDLKAYVELGPPTTLDNFLHLFTTMIFPILWIGSIVGTLVLGMWKERRQRRDYARVASQLNEIDRARAEALQGRYNATSCPICLEDFKPPAEEGGVATVGSDGQPIKLLRCGHCMDETCWAEWINSGRGTITKCPICQQDIGGGDVGATGSGTQRNLGVAQNNNLNHANPDDMDRALEQQRQEEEENRIMRQYRRERNFRLARLGYRYPQIIRPNQIQRWSQPTYDGTLVRDPSFVQSNPAARTAARSSGSGGSRSGFGGSASGGGRGGRW